MSDRNEKPKTGEPVKTGDNDHRDIEIEEVAETAEHQKRREAETKGRGRGKGKSRSKEVEKLKQQLAELQDKYLRQVAEFENFRKRKEREVEEFWRRANADLIRKLLPILDDIERSLDSARRDENFEALVEGIEMIYRSFLRVLEAEGVKQISAVGEEFDPEIHEALMQVDKDDVPPHTVVEEHQKGYLLGDLVLRPAKVVVSKG